MDKSVLKKIAYELKMKFEGNPKAFVFAVCNNYLRLNNIFDRDKWLKDFLEFDENISEDVFEFLECYNKELIDIQSIGWLYQYFISDQKERVFNNLMKNIKVEKEDIPFATQLFTPNWIIKFLVENSLGKVIKEKKLEEIKFIDPCQGTGNILIYAFDIFYKAYLEKGYSKKEAVYNILTKNLYGTDIDETVCLITKLILLLKSNCFEKSIINKLNIICIKSFDEMENEKSFQIYENYKNVVDLFKNAEEFGALIKIPKDSNFEIENVEENKLLKQFNILIQKYDVVCTNPPYMGKKNINLTLSEFLKKEYPDTKSELYAAFIEKCLEWTSEKGYLAMITIHSWMFISSFTNLRKKLLENGTIITMLHTGPATFDDLSSFNVLATSFVYKKEKIDIDSEFIRLADYYNLQEKIENIDNKDNYYYLKQKKFFEIPNQPLIYWISNDIRNCFKNNKRLDEFYSARQGLATGNNKEFVKFWYEVPFDEIGLNCQSTEEFFQCGKIYAPYNKGGIFRKWYGNLEYVIKFDEENYNKLLNQGNHLPSRKYYFEKGITWSLFGFENFGVRFKDFGYVFDVSGSSMFPDEKDLYYVIGYLCSNVCFRFLSCLAPTVNFQVGNIASLPFKIIKDLEIRNKINYLVKENIEICKKEWSFYETNIEFKGHPFVLKDFKKKSLEETIEKFENYYNSLRNKLRKNEEELNKIYAKIFDVEKDIDVSVNDRDLTVKPFNKNEFIKSYLSYIVGCFCGRYNSENCRVNYSKCRYEIKIEEIIQYVDNFLGQDNKKYIEQILKKSIDKFYKKEFIEYHKKHYQNHPIYFL